MSTGIGTRSEEIKIKKILKMGVRGGGSDGDGSSPEGGKFDWV